LIIAAPAKADWSSVRGEGSMTCADFSHRYAESPTDAKLAALQWSMGYFSGMNAILFKSFKVSRDLNSLSSDTIFSIETQYCAGHPLDNLITAATEAFLRLTPLNYAQKKFLDDLPK
jgi:hypothetical protein